MGHGKWEGQMANRKRGRYERILVCLGAMVLLAACDTTQSLPLGPTRTTGSNPPPTPQPVPPTTSYTVSGVVRTRAGIPVAGARVVVLGQAGSISTTTDGSGNYSIAGVEASFDRMSPLLSASSAGYFTDVEFADSAYLPIVKDTKVDFRLAPVAPISLGEVIQGRSPVGDRVCSHWGYGASACQRFALAAPASGTLEVTISAPQFEFDFDIVAPDGTFALYDGSWRGPLSVSIPVVAGATYEIRVIGGWNPPRAFELTTALR
jgi:hypothetical protein